MKFMVNCDVLFFHNFKEKLAVFVSKYDVGIEELIKYFKYPYIEFSIRNKVKGNIIIFKNEEIKNNFVKEFKVILEEEKQNDTLNIEKRHMLVGNYMGFPPKAVEYFSCEKYKTKDTNSPINISMNYYGLYFASYPETIEEDIKWLEDTYSKKFINNTIDQLKTYEILI